jgi:alkyl hydroperoxide reductase subunit AhpC
VALRGLFIIDPSGILQYGVVHSLNIGRSTDETLRVLEALQTGGLCPSDWKPGQRTLQKPASPEPRRAA